jgi:hypothetical protein
MRTSPVILGTILVGGAALSGCKKKTEGFQCDGATVSDTNATVIQLAFDTEGEGTSWVEFAAEGGPTHLSPTVGPTTNHRHTLLGVPGGQEVSYTVTLDVDGEEQTCEGSVTTKPTPVTFPPLTVMVDTPEAYVEPYLLVTFIGESNVLAVIDRKGAVLWYMDASENELFLQDNIEGWTDSALDVVSVIHASLWPEQGQILYNLQAQSEVDVGSLLWTNWLKEPLRAEVLPASHHTFTQHADDGTIAFLRLDVRDWYDKETKETVPVVGDSLLELDPEGNETEIFNTWDYFEVEKNSRWNVMFYPFGHDWTHGNAVTWFEESQSYLFSFANINTFMEFSPKSGPGRIFEWGTWQFPEGTTPFSYQHDPRFGPDGTVSMVSTLDETEGIVYSIDDENQALTQVWSTGEGEGLYAFALGENRPLANGNRLVSFGSAAVIREVDENEQVVWEVRGSPKDYWIGSVEPFNDFYTYE